MTDTNDIKTQVPSQGTRASMGDIPPKGKPPTVRAAKDVKANALTPKANGTEPAAKHGPSARANKAPAKAKKNNAKTAKSAGGHTPVAKKTAAKSAPKKTAPKTAAHGDTPVTVPQEMRVPGLPASAEAPEKEDRRSLNATVPERAQAKVNPEMTDFPVFTDAESLSAETAPDDNAVSVFSIDEPDDIPESAFEDAGEEAVCAEADSVQHATSAAIAEPAPASTVATVPEQASKTLAEERVARASKSSKKAAKTRARVKPFSDLIGRATLGLPDEDTAHVPSVADAAPAEETPADDDPVTPSFTPDSLKGVNSATCEAAFVPDLNDSPDDDPDQARIYRGYELAPERTTTLKPEPLRKLKAAADDDTEPEITVIELADDDAVLAQAGRSSVEALECLTRQAQSAQAVITDRLQSEARRAWELRNDEARQAREAGPQKTLREEARRALDEQNARMAAAPVPVPPAELVSGAGLAPDAAHLEAAADYARQVAAFEDEALRRGHVCETGTVAPASAKPVCPAARDALAGPRMPLPPQTLSGEPVTTVHPAPETVQSIVNRLTKAWLDMTFSLKTGLTMLFVAAVGAISAVTTVAFLSPAPLFVHADLDRVRRTMLLATLMDKAGLPSGRQPILLSEATDALSPLPPLNDTLLQEALLAVARQTGSTVLGTGALLAMPEDNRSIPDVTDSLLTVLGLQSFDTDRAQRALNQLLSGDERRKLSAAPEVQP